MIKGHGAPDVNTISIVGSKYLDLDTNTVYECVDVTEASNDYGFIDVSSRTNNAVCTWEKCGQDPQNVVFADGITTMNTTLEGFAAHIVEIVVPEGVTTLEQSENGEGGTARFQMFPNLRKLTLPGSLGTVPNLGASDTNLWDCLKELVLTEGFTTIGFAQFEYYSLEKIEIPSTMVEIGERAFDGNCMKTIIIHKPENSIAGAPWGATNAEVIWTG